MNGDRSPGSFERTEPLQTGMKDRGLGSLVSLIREELKEAASPGAARLVDAIRARHGDAVHAVLFYGSCRRDEDSEGDGLLDFYVFVERYGDLYDSRLAALGNAILPPNVFYLQTGEGDNILRTKYSVISFADFARGTSPRHFHAYFWARFAQPCTLVYAQTEAYADAVAEALADAVRTFVLRALPLADERFRIEDLWVRQFDQSYRGELRPERRSASEQLYDANRERYERVTRAALRELPVDAVFEVAGGEEWVTVRLSTWSRRLAMPLWRLRRVVGKVFSVLRIAKGAFTFEGGVDYALWKIQRHSGATIEVNWREQRHPLLALAGIFWRLYRRGAIR
jgi:hypothetical protein